MSDKATGQQFLFSAGNLFMIDSSGTPREATVIQSAEVDFATSTKSLQDTYKVAKLVALADLKISGKFSAAEWSAETMAMGLANCATVTKGTQYKLSNEETATLSSTVQSFTAANASGFNQDLGVDDVSSIFKLISMNKFSDATLGTVGTVTATGAAAGGSIAAGTYYIRCAYITSILANKLTLNVQAPNMTLDADYGVTAASVAVNTGALTGSANMITANVAANSSAGGYAWYVGSASGSETLQEVTSTNSISLSSLVSGGDEVPTADTSAVVPAGYYKVVSGVYSFNPAECAAGLTIKPKYMYKTTNDGGRLISINNTKQGLATYYQMFLSGTLVNQAGIAEQANIWLFAITCNKLGISMKIGEFNYPSYEYQAFSTAANTIGYMSLGGAA